MTHHLPLTAHHSDPFQQFINAMFRGAGYHIGYMLAVVIFVGVGIYYLKKFLDKNGGVDGPRNPRNGRR